MIKVHANWPDNPQEFALRACTVCESVGKSLIPPTPWQAYAPHSLRGELQDPSGFWKCAIRTLEGHVMRKRVPRRFAIVTAACLFGIVIAAPSMAPTASADPLGNGYNVTCTPNGTDAVCNISGCPRLVEDDAGDVVHVTVNGKGQQELDKACNNTTTTTIHGPITAPATVAVQGCRKEPSVVKDKCGAWSSYTYTPPAAAANNSPPANVQKPVVCTGAGGGQGTLYPPGSSCCPAGSVALAVPAGQQCQAGAPVNCPAGSVSATVPAGQQCQAAPPPTNAVTLNFQKDGLQINAIIVNNSTVSGQCRYDAVNTNGIIPERVDTFPIGAKATVTRPYPAPPPLAAFHATVKCTGDFNGKSDEFGDTSADVTG